MANKQKQLTPFEQAEYNRSDGMKRLAGIIITQAWIERIRALHTAKVRMSSTEKKQWHELIVQAAIAQDKHFGPDA